MRHLPRLASVFVVCVGVIERPLLADTSPALSNASGAVIHVGVQEGDIRGNDHRALQAAVDYVSGLGGGTVKIGPGRYSMRNALTLRDNVRVVGTKGKTILVPVPGVKVRLTSDGDANQRAITVADASELRVGDRVLISDDRYPSAFQVTSATLIRKTAPRTFQLSDPLYLDYLVSRNARAELSFPAVGGWRIKNASIEGVTIEGNRARTKCKAMDGCRTGGIYLFQCEKVTIRNCVVRNYNGDGISFQVSKSVVVEDCRVENCVGLGLHPGSGSQHPLVRRNQSVGNGGDGLFVCWRVKHGVFENNLIRGNNGAGVSIGHKDTDNMFRGNRILSNGETGVLFRTESKPMGADRNTFEDNIILDNGTGKGGQRASVVIKGHHSDVVFRNNTIGHKEVNDKRIGILLGPGAKRFRATKNKFVRIQDEIIRKR